VDDDEGNREMLARRLRHRRPHVTLAANGLEALQLVRAQPFDLVLLDLIMPGLDGYQVLSKMKGDAALREIPVIMISALDQENGVARCIELGAEDYLAKPFNPVFLRARLGASLEKRRLREQERATFTALQESQKRLAAELAEAAEYVRSLLPRPLGARTSCPRVDDAVVKLADRMSALQADWRFIPSTELGGDVLSYHWLDDDHFAAFIVDVCGHGMTAAIFSITILNVLRSQALPETDFRDPGRSAHAIERTLPDGPAEQHVLHDLVRSVRSPHARTELRERRASAGGIARSNGASAFTSTAHAWRHHRLFAGSEVSNARCTVPPGATLFVFSDGAYEIARADGTTLTLQDLIAQLETLPDPKLDSLIAWASQMRSGSSFEDDLSVVELTFA
jgi:sigma-B regulation protein RsbU (phosphoserine phosphatase)